ncbi:MAG: ABC transporter substrate-binding protein [Lachnospiraceae bacterium]|jgi:branched-chain amino acid transport system substrate-binding protein|nr:ABC transporter substrate-binding protein [Lachnospiraceae bacterium]
MKKAISVTMAAIMAFSLTACTGTVNDSPGTTAAPDAAAAETTKAASSDSGSGDAQKEENKGGEAASGETIKIGVLTDRSSVAAATVTWAEAGAILALEEANEEGGLNGVPFELVYRDTASDSANVAQKATELVNEGCIAILGPKSDGEAPTGATWAEENKFPMVTPCTMNTRVTIENASKYMFSCGYVAWPIAKMNAKYAKDQGFGSAFFIGNDGGASGDSRDFFYRELGDSFQNFGSNQVSSNSTEFSAIISSVVGKDPDVIIGAVAGPNFVSLVNQGGQFGLWDMCDYLGWYTCDSTNTSALAEAGNYPYGKVHGVDLWPFWMDEIEGNAEFVQAYSDIGKKYYNQEIYPSDMGYTWYVGIKAIVEAARTTPDDLTPEGMTNALSKVHFSTMYGDDLYFRDFDHLMAHAYYYVTAVEDTTGKWSIPVGDVYAVYEGDEMLPSKEEVQKYAEENGYVFKDLSQ